MAGLVASDSPPTLLFGMMIGMLMTWDFIVWIVGSFWLEGNQAPEQTADLKPQEVTGRMHREAALRNLFGGLLKVWLIVNTENVAVYDLNMLWNIVEAYHIVIECGYAKTVSWRQDRLDIIILRAIPLAVMYAYRGTFKEGDLDWIVYGGYWYFVPLTLFIIYLVPAPSRPTDATTQTETRRDLNQLEGPTTAVAATGHD